MNFLKILKIDNINTLVIKKEGKENNFFAITPDSFIISVQNFSFLLKYMLFEGIISPKLLEGVLGEYYDFIGK